jgi:hypothetical protein
MSWKPKRSFDREILRTLGRVRAFYLSDLLPERHTPEESAALHRAARDLVALGKIAVFSWYSLDEPATGLGTVIHRPNEGLPDVPGQVVRLKR